MNSDVWSLLLTGPIDEREVWMEAVAAAGWQALDAALLEREILPFEPPDPFSCALVALTSSGALPALVTLAREDPRFLEVPLAALGSRTADRAKAAGFRVTLVGDGTGARSLAGSISAAGVTGKVLWLRGERAIDLEQALAENGLACDARTVYRTKARGDIAVPRADVVFFASPSAVFAWCEQERGFLPGALALGWTTLEALQSAEQAFSFALPLITPQPRSLTVALEAIAQAP